MTRFGAVVLGSRRLVRAPIWIYRARLGFVFGSRLLLLEHVGRASGARRQVVLEVIGHPEPGTYAVASGFGLRAQWYRNILVNPNVRITVAGRRGEPAIARIVAEEEAKALLDTYIARHPRAWPLFKAVIEGALDGPANGLPIVALRPVSQHKFDSG